MKSKLNLSYWWGTSLSQYVKVIKADAQSHKLRLVGNSMLILEWVFKFSINYRNDRSNNRKRLYKLLKIAKPK
jgi:hypothetical protein